MISNVPPGAEYDSNAPWIDVPEYECNECGKPIEKEGYCSNGCWEASML